MAGDAGQLTVPGYEILSELGRGGMGIVCKAQDTRLPRTVALKFLLPQYARDPQRLERFRREAYTASALNHPHICTIHDIKEHEGQPFIVMEFVEGRTLRALVGQHAALEEPVRLVRQVADALRAAHAAGIVHRDIKPENVMVRDDGYAKVLDFGLARLLPTSLIQTLAETPGTVPGTIAGTVRYMSPEQTRGEAVETPTDIFSLGIVLYELTTGRHPFRAASQIAVMQAIGAEAPVHPSRLNPPVAGPLEGLILKMLHKDARLRPTAAEVSAMLNELARKSSNGRASQFARFLKPHTVGRQKELEGLYAGFESAAGGRGLLLCVAGEPGIGKTTLVEDFLAGLASRGEALSILRGRCSERLAGAEAYLPVLEALESLLRSEAGESAARVMQAVAPTWYVQVAPLGKDDSSFARAQADARASSQERMKREFNAFLQELSSVRPLILFLDDLHWADVSTVDLLVYLSSKCSSTPVLFVLTYRPTALFLSNHPFLPIKLELQGRGVCREIQLGFLSRADIDSYLALAFPGHGFPAEFAALMHAKTEGNPLFMVDLLHYLRARGVIAEEQGRWTLTQAVPDFQRELPEGVRAMIQRKIEQLGEAERRLLVAASVQGYEFDSAVVAKALGMEAAEIEERLDVLERVHAFVRQTREHEFPDRTLTIRYGFVHVLYQNALYASVRPARKASLSRAVAQALLDYYGENRSAVAAELAVLFEAARDFSPAADYFLLAAQNAAQVFASREAVVLANRGLGLLKILPEAPRRAEVELQLQMILGLNLQITKGYAALEVNQAYTRARELAEQMIEGPQLGPVYWGIQVYYTVKGDLRRGRALAEQLLGLAQTGNDQTLLLLGHSAMGVTSLYLGELHAARAHLETVQQYRSHSFTHAHDPVLGSLSYAAVALWALGYPDQALRQSLEVLSLAEELGHPHTLVSGLGFASVVYLCRGEGQAARDRAEAALTISTEHGFSFWWTWALIFRGSALAKQGSRAEGIAQMRQGVAGWQATGAKIAWGYQATLLAEALGKEGQPEDGLTVLAEALAVTRGTGERHWQAELYRLKGELLLMHAGVRDGWPATPAGIGLRPEAEQSVLTEAEGCYRQALDVARRQNAKSFELRAVISLSRLYEKQGKKDEARQMLGDIYGWFTEGFDTEDLNEARLLLHELA